MLLIFIVFNLIAQKNSYAIDLESLLEEKVFNEPTWAALLHYQSEKFDIDDPHFYLNKKKRNLKDEFIESYQQFFIIKNSEMVCKFPARYFWLATKLNIKTDFSHCDELNEFRAKAPFSNLKVVFASENVTSPTSMMGHIFLKITGMNEKNEELNHSISFFTDVDNLSFPELTFKSLITGMNGHYALAPYEISKNVYLHDELRNVWEYELTFDEFQKTILQYHLHELREITFRYYFHGFNCATLINNILAVPYPETFSNRNRVVTPLDIVRKVYQGNHIEKTYVFTTSQWKINALFDSSKFNKKTVENLKEKKYSAIIDDTEHADQKLYVRELAKAHNDYLLEEVKINKNQWEMNRREIGSVLNNHSYETQLDLSNYKKPQLTPNDSQFIISYKNRDMNNLLILGFLPASHDLVDNNSNYNDESALKLSEVNLAYDFKQKKLKIDSLNLYSISRFKPVNDLLNNWSGYLEASYSSELSREFNYEKFYNLKVGMGKTYRLSDDIDFFGLLGSGGNINKFAQFYVKPEIGFIIREVWGLKTILNISKMFYDQERINDSNEIFMRQSLNFENYALGISYKKNWNEQFDLSEYALTLKYIY